MTIEEKREQLEKELCSIPSEKWEYKNGFTAKYRNIDVSLNRGSGGGPPYFSIESYTIYTKRAWPLLNELEDREHISKVAIENKLLDNLLGL